ncbi:MAG: hypothetical protein J7K37_05890 [Candidatus Omnitrophica bacterium]|nr:hypothetical protein [Candidatus Omnitrophota bacterium]
MIIPDKMIKFKYSFLGAGSKMLKELAIPQTVSSLWEKVKYMEEIKTFDKFILILDFLYMLGLIEFKGGLLRKVKNDQKSQE